MENPKCWYYEAIYKHSRPIDLTEVIEMVVDGGYVGTW